MTMMPLPASPFGNIAPTIRDSSLGAYTWLCSPAGMINRFVEGTHLDVAHVRFITERVDNAMMAAFPQQKYYYIHDFSSALSYTSESRQCITDWGKLRQQQGCVELVVIIPPKMSSFFAMATNTAAMALRLVGMNVEIADDLASVVRRLDLKPY